MHHAQRTVHPFGSKFVVLTVLLLATVNTSATQIIILGMNPAFYVAADSLVAVPGSTPIQECKIHQTGKIIWTAGGLDLDKKTGFSVRDYFRKNGGMGRAEETLDSISQKIIPALQKELPVLKRIAPDFYARIITRGAILTLYAVGIFDHRVEAVRRILTSSTAKSRNKPATDARLLVCVPVI